MQVMSDAETMEYDSDSSVMSNDSDFGLLYYRPGYGGDHPGYMFQEESRKAMRRVLNRMRYSLRRLFNQGRLRSPSIWSNGHLQYRQHLKNLVSSNPSHPVYALPRAQTYVSGVDDFDFGFTRFGTDVILRIRRNMRNYVRRWRAWRNVGIPLQWATIGSTHNSANGRSYGWVYTALGQRPQQGVGARLNDYSFFNQ